MFPQEEKGIDHKSRNGSVLSNSFPTYKIMGLQLLLSEALGWWPLCAWGNMVATWGEHTLPFPRLLWHKASLRLWCWGRFRAQVAHGVIHISHRQDGLPQLVLCFTLKQSYQSPQFSPLWWCSFRPNLHSVPLHKNQHVWLGGKEVWVARTTLFPWK